MRRLLASTFMVSLAMGLVGLTLVLYAANELDASYIEIGLLGATYVVFNVLFSPISGRVADRQGRKPFLVFGFFIVTCSFALYPLIKAIWWLLLIRLIQGAAEAPIWVNAQAAVADLSRSEKRGRAMGAYGTSWVFGFAIGPFIGGYLYHTFGAIPAFTLGVLLTLVASFVMLATSLPKPHIVPQRIKFAELGPACFIGFVYIGVMSVIILILPVYLYKLDMSAVQVGSLVALLGIVRGVLFVPMGGLSDKHGPWRVIKLGLFGLMVGSACLVLTAEYFLLIPIVVILAAAEGSIYPAVMSIVSKIGGQTSAYVLGIFNAVSMLGWGILPVAGGYLADNLDPVAPYLMCAAISLATLIFLWKFLPRKK